AVGPHHGFAGKKQHLAAALVNHHPVDREHSTPSAHPFQFAGISRLCQTGSKEESPMIRIPQLLLAVLSVLALQAQTAEELVQKNILAKGGIEKIKSVKTYRMTGRMQQGSFSAEVGRDGMAPDLTRE